MSNNPRPYLRLIPDGWRGFLTPPGRQRPQLDDLGFDPRLISADRLLRLAGRHPQELMKTQDGELDGLILRCRSCGAEITHLADSKGVPYTVTGQQMLMNTLRHLVMHHDVPLSGQKEADKWAEIVSIPRRKKKIRLFRRR